MTSQPVGRYEGARRQRGLRLVAGRAGRAVLGGTTAILVGTIVATVGAYVFQLLGGRVLGAEAFAPVSVLWTLQFLIMTVVMIPIEQLVIRRLELSGGRSAEVRRSARPVLLLLCIAIVVIVGGAALMSERLLAGQPLYAVLAGLLIVGYAVFALARGHLAGRHRYHAYGIATAAESLSRVVLAAVVLVVWPDPLALGVVMVLAPFAVLIVRPFRAAADASTAERPVLVEGDEGYDAAALESGVDRTGRFLVPLVGANAASQVVIGAGPLVAAALGASAAVVSAVFVTFALFRGPLWIMQSVLARVLPPFTVLAASGRHATLSRSAVAIGLVGSLLGAAALPVGWVLGPPVVSLLFGSEFAPSATVAGLAASATALAAMTLFASQVLVAYGRTERLAIAWGVALAVATAVVVVFDAAPEVRVAAGFLAGELTALLLVSVAGARTAAVAGHRASRTMSTSTSTSTRPNAKPVANAQPGTNARG